MDNINIILYKGLKNYFSTLFNYGEMNASNTNKLLVLKYIKDLLSSGRVFTYKQTNIIQAVVRCLAGTSCLLEVPKSIIKNSYAPTAPAQKEESYTDAIKLLQEEYETLSNEMKTKQPKLIAGDNITIQNNVISATGSSPFTVNLSPLGADRFSPDKTWTEVQNAYTNGNDIKFNLSGQEFIVTMFIVNGGLAASTVVLDSSEPVVYTLSWISTDNYVLVANAGIPLQRKLTFDNVPTQSSNNPVKSGGVYDTFNTYCPIIEDTRSSAVATITGVAPFSELVSGQRICLHLNYRTANNQTLQLTLSGGTQTSAIPIYHSERLAYTVMSRMGGLSGVAGMYIDMVYDGSSWIVNGFGDGNTQYNIITQAEIDAGTGTTARSITPKMLCDNFDKVTTLVEVTATGDVTQALDSGKFYRFGEVDSLTLTFTAPSAGLGMWGGKFTASANWSALGIPATIDEAAGNDSIAGGKTYEFNMVDNVIIIKEI